MNPNSIALYFQMDRTWSEGSWPFGYSFIVRPIGGEFSADPLSANIMSVARLSAYSKAFANKSVVVDPFMGYEFGRNLKSRIRFSMCPST